MRAPGWFWWGWLLVPPFVVAAAIGLLWLAWPLFIVSGMWPLWAFLAAVFLAGALGPVVAAISTRRRYHQWLAALHAVDRGQFIEPLAAPDPVRGLPLSVEPLAIPWRYTRGARWSLGFAIGQLVFDVYMLARLIIARLPDRGIALHGLLAQAADNRDLRFSLLIPFGLLVGIALIAQALIAHPFGVVADEEGIELRRVLGRRRLVRWEDALFFQFLYDGDRYLLFTRRGYITWRWHHQPKMLRPVGLSYADATARNETLLAVIEQRTGLALQRAVR